MKLTVWLKVSGVTLYVGGDPLQGKSPILTAVLERPQILIDHEKNTITIVETKQEVKDGSNMEEISL